MATNTNSKQRSSSVFQAADFEDDDDFQDSNCPTPTPTPRFVNNNLKIISNAKNPSCSQQPHLKPLNSSKRAKACKNAASGKENLGFQSKPTHFQPLSPPPLTTTITATASPCNTLLDDDDCGLDSILLSAVDCKREGDTASLQILKQSDRGGVYSLESRLLASVFNHPVPYDYGSSVGNSSGILDNHEKSDDGDDDGFSEPCTQLDLLLNLCSEQDGNSGVTECRGLNNIPIHCPLCGADISHFSNESRQLHTNDCLDREETLNVACPKDDVQPMCPGQVVDVSPVLEWLRSLGLAKYEEIFVREEIGWDTLQGLTEEDLFSIGVTALGPRKKIIHALSELRKDTTKSAEISIDASRNAIGETSGLGANKLITDYFPGTVGHRKNDCTFSSGRIEAGKNRSDAQRKQIVVKKKVLNKKLRDIPQWCCVPGTPFRVDAFKYLRRDCSHWFLTHFHIDHYQGLTRSFSHGKIYCSLVTAKLVNMKIGIAWDKLQVLPLNQNISISGIDVTCFDANHCPGSIIVLFEPPNGKAVLHTGDFRFCQEMTKIPVLQMRSVQTLILDTTYCNPQEAVIQFVIEAIQAEAFNPKTLFLIGSYTIGKERLYLEVARVLRKKVYVTAAKLRLLECLGLSGEDMQWFTLNEQESHIHVVPMWTLASFKRLKCISNQYTHRFSLIVAFSPTGWTFGKGKKSSGRRWQQGTIVRYEVPYSEHCSFTELREFVKFISPENIIPSVNNDGVESAKAMISLLMS
ncbi:uncharacterized protein LOC130788572 isoform X2 [Actinidia eriantha]|uniref:uncharacterized protein LOC130788572 isoform X2 n=1 Tax=Actinidia eriantha TaxID=165200 RepID=UPI00258DEB00|nr:uncharacterized protein LOC130788572 isoform X2 [Actinidia eriantha]